MKLTLQKFDVFYQQIKVLVFAMLAAFIANDNSCLKDTCWFFDESDCILLGLTYAIVHNHFNTWAHVACLGQPSFFVCLISEFINVNGRSLFRFKPKLQLLLSSAHCQILLQHLFLISINRRCILFSFIKAGIQHLNPMKINVLIFQFLQLYPSFSPKQVGEPFDGRVRILLDLKQKFAVVAHFKQLGLCMSVQVQWLYLFGLEAVQELLDAWCYAVLLPLNFDFMVINAAALKPALRLAHLLSDSLLHQCFLF